MYEQENQRVTHLIILFVYTFLTIALAGESLLLGWDMGVVVLLLAALIVSWVLHITEKIPEQNRLWIYFILMMLTFFFYGIHETSIYDLAPVTAVVIIMYLITEKYIMIKLCVATYFLTLCYDFAFVIGKSVKINALTVTRTILHITLVCMAGYLAKIVLQGHRREKIKTENRITELKETNRRAEDFLANVSHELRTPINAVTGITTVMLEKEADEEKKKDILSIQMAGNRLFGQIEDILDYTEVDTGKIRVSKDAYMISSVINDIIASNHLKERENLPEIIFDLDARIPAVLLGDEKKIKKILKHLLDNAIKFTRKGGIYIRISALSKSYGINLCIQVSDTGVGIAKEELGRITERFYQSGGGRNRRAGGLGLGLSIVYGMVHAMNGFIQIESKQEKGTTVSVSIPQQVVDEKPGMMITNRDKLCLACFIAPEQFDIPEVRNYYDEMISHMVQELEVSLHRVSNREELERLISMYRLTHLFIGKREYKENQDYLEDLAQSIQVIMVADDSITLAKESKIKLLKKPFFGLPVVHILNVGVSQDSDMLKKKQMICPGVRVLVVDDEPMNLMVAEGIFKSYQMIVKTAESGLKAIELCQREDFDLIFLDHMMPEMDGVETLKKLRGICADQNRKFIVIAFSANAVSGAREMFLQEGFDDFVSKPIERVELDRVLKKVLPRSAVVVADDEGGKKEIDMDIDNQKIINDEMINEKSFEGSLKETQKKCMEDAGVHMDAGIRYCYGDPEFYEELVIAFAKDAKKKLKEIKNFLQQEDFENYCILVHSLKSSAKMIGADSLSEKAKKAEKASKNHDADYIREHNEELLTAYRQVVQCISEVFELESENSAKKDTAVVKELSKVEFIERLTELKEVLDTFEADKAALLISNMSGMVYKEKSVGKLLNEVQQDVEDFEFVKASQKVETLLDRIERGEAE